MNRQPFLEDLRYEYFEKLAFYQEKYLALICCGSFCQGRLQVKHEK